MTAAPLEDRRILVVEDEYYLAMDLAADLSAAGAIVIGPAPSIEMALALIADETHLDAAVLDINLGGHMVYPVADTLLARAVPFVFATGNFDGTPDAAYPQISCCEKPLEFRTLQSTLVDLIHPNRKLG